MRAPSKEQSEMASGSGAQVDGEKECCGTGRDVPDPGARRGVVCPQAREYSEPNVHLQEQRSLGLYRRWELREASCAELNTAGCVGGMGELKGLRPKGGDWRQGSQVWAAKAGAAETKSLEANLPLITVEQREAP